MKLPKKSCFFHVELSFLAFESFTENFIQIGPEMTKLVFGVIGVNIKGRLKTVKKFELIVHFDDYC